MCCFCYVTSTSTDIQKPYNYNCYMLARLLIYCDKMDPMNIVIWLILFYPILTQHFYRYKIDKCKGKNSEGCFHFTEQ